MRQCTCGQFKAFFVIPVICLHQPVPNVEVQPEIGRVFFMVQGMVSDGVEQESSSALQEPLWKNFVAAMSEDVEHNLECHEQHKSGCMDRQGAHKEWTDSGLDQCFHGTKGVCGPRCGIDREMMSAVEPTE